MRKIARKNWYLDLIGQPNSQTRASIQAVQLRRVQRLTADDKLVFPERCRRLLRRVTPQNWEQILFTDETLFAIEQAHNHQNDRSWYAEAPGTSAKVDHLQNPKSVMVLSRICAIDKTNLVFVSEGVKIDQSVFHRYIVDTVVVPWARRHFGRQQWIVQ